MSIEKETFYIVVYDYGISGEKIELTDKAEMIRIVTTRNSPIGYAHIYPIEMSTGQVEVAREVIASAPMSTVTHKILAAMQRHGRR